MHTRYVVTVAFVLVKYVGFLLFWSFNVEHSNTFRR